MTHPVLKWAGGKRQMLGQYKEFFPHRFNAYHEPFLGGGAVFFHLAPPVAYLSDWNDELINMYLVIQTGVDQLVEDLSQHKNEEEYYYRVRALDTRSLDEVQRASRLIFLNKTCYNGLYRVNKKGQFNVPFGKYKRPGFFDVDLLLSASAALRQAKIFKADFNVVLENAGTGDLVYFDPPYFPLSRTASFTDFTDRSFGAKDQERLAETFHELVKMGCLVMLSNSDTPFIRELYSRYGRGVISLSANRSINSKGDRRGPVGELLICSWIR
ncbi:MAG: DNA adenine methylase [Desulfocucumaceae bacterium]